MFFQYARPIMTSDQIARLLDRKYSFQRTLFNLLGHVRKEKGATISIEIC